MDDESDQQARLRERIKELEDAIASQKDAVLESCAVPTKVETASVSVQTVCCGRGDSWSNGSEG